MNFDTYKKEKKNGGGVRRGASALVKFGFPVLSGLPKNEGFVCICRMAG